MTIYRATLRAICRLLGFDPDEVSEIHIYIDRVEVHRYEPPFADLIGQTVTAYSIGEGVPQ